MSAPPGAWVIDGSGLTVYPGLMNGLSTVAMSAEDAPPPPTGGRGFGRGGGPNQDGPPPSAGPADRPATYTWVSAADRLEPEDGRLSAWRAAGFTTVVTAPTRGFFAGDAAAINLAGDRPRQMVLKPSVAHRVNLSGGPGHRGYPSLGPELSIVVASNQVLIDRIVDE